MSILMMPAILGRQRPCFIKSPNHLGKIVKSQKLDECQQGHLGTSRASIRTGPVHFYLWMAHHHCRRSRDLGELSERSIHAVQHGDGNGSRRRNDRGISFRHIRSAGKYLPQREVGPSKRPPRAGVCFALSATCWASCTRPTCPSPPPPSSQGNFAISSASP